MGKFNACPSHPTLRIRSLIRVWVLVLALLFNVSSLAFWVRPVSAASIDVASDTMTRHKISTASDHTIAFDTPTGVDADSDTIIVTFDAGFDLSSITITDVDFEVNGTDKLIASSAGAGVWGYSRSGQIITFTAPTDAASGEVSANDTITVRIGSGSGTTWNLSVVDDGGGDNVGQYTSISAVDSNTVFISYYDVTNDDLLFAKTTNGGSSWTLSTVESSGNVGEFTSISAVDASTIYISYFDRGTNIDLKVAKSTDGGDNWTLTTVDSTGSVGRYTSIDAVDANTVFISYYAQGGTDDLKVAKTTDGGDNWTPSTVDSTGNVGTHTSISAVDANTVYISYRDVTNSNLKVAKTTDGGDNWTPSTVDNSGFINRDTSIHAFDASTVYISYMDDTNDDLEFAKTTDGGDNWTLTTVDSAGSVGRYSSIDAVDANTIFISYQGFSIGGLKVAYTTDGGTSWTPSAVDTGSSVGQYTSIAAVDASTVFSSHYGATNDELKFAKSYDADGVGSNQIVNPGTIGSKEISIGGTFGDSGEIDVPIMDDDQVTISASVNTSIAFDLDIENKEPHTIGASHSESAAPYSIDLQELTFASITDEDTTSVAEIYVNLIVSNADDGGIIQVLSANGATGLSSASSGDAIPSATATLATDSLNGGYGLAADEQATATEGTLTEISPFNVFGVTGGVGGLTTSFQTIFNTGGAPIVGGDGVIAVRAVAGTSTSAADDYTDTLTFRATATF